MGQLAVTIGLPVYNAAPFLEDALRSIFAQSLSNWEVLLIDDGSSDASLTMLKRIRDPRVFLVADGRHRGLAARLNQVIQMARGRYIARMDSDDLMHPYRLETQLQFLERNPDVDAVGCGLLILGRKGGPVGVRVLPTEHNAICAHPLNGFGLAHATLMARTAWFRQHLYNDQNRGCEDWELWLSSYENSRFANLPEPLYFYREYDSFALSKYLRAKSRRASFLWACSESRFGFLERLHAVGRQYSRMAVYTAATMFGLTDLLLRRRSMPLDLPGQEFSPVLQSILRTHLPTDSTAELSRRKAFPGAVPVAEHAKKQTG